MSSISTIFRDNIKFRCINSMHYDAAITVAKRYTGPMKYVVDIGACAGGLSLYAAKRGASKVEAYEPDRNSMEMFIQNIEANGYLDVIHPHQSCVLAAENCGDDITLNWLREAQVSVIYNPGLEEHFPNKFKSETISFADVARAFYEIDYLKIDIEGGEYCLIDEEFLKIVREKVRFLDIELHPMDSFFDRGSEVILQKYRGRRNAMSELKEDIDSQCNLSCVYAYGGIGDGMRLNLGYAKFPNEFSS